MIFRFLHWIAHLTGKNSGKIVSWKEDEKIFIGFECSGCGEIDKSTIHDISIDKFLNRESEIKHEQ